MLSTGVDIVEVERIQKSMGTPRFVERLFTQEEQRLFEARGYNPQVVAGNFAAKEAIIKALDSHFGRVAMTDVSVLRNELGAPYYVFSGKLLDIVRENKLKFSLTMSNTAQYAVAFVVCYTEGTTL